MNVYIAFVTDRDEWHKPDFSVSRTRDGAEQYIVDYLYNFYFPENEQGDFWPHSYPEPQTTGEKYLAIFNLVHGNADLDMDVGIEEIKI